MSATLQQKEKLLIENLLSSNDIFSRCIGILKPDYFEQKQYKPVIKFCIDYFNNYKDLPSIDIVNAEYDLHLVKRALTTSEYNYTCTELELFCRKAAFILALQSSFADIESNADNSFESAYKKMGDAMLVSLQKDLGEDIYDNPEKFFNSCTETEINYPTGIETIDRNLDGGLARQTLTLFSANSGVGKSIIKTNIGYNYSLMGFHVVYLSLELPQKMVRIRASVIATNNKIANWRDNIKDISEKLNNIKEIGAGSYILKRMPSGTKTLDIRSYLKHYEVEYKRKPDVIIIDYMDIMHPNNGIKNKSIYDQDKEKSEEIVELLIDYDAIGITASQQNRDALRRVERDQGVIAGGISKVNTVHNYIAMFQDEQQHAHNELSIVFLKTRTSNGKGNTELLDFNQETLIISDIDPNKKKLPLTVKQTKQTPAKSSFKNDKINNLISRLKGGQIIPKDEALNMAEEIFSEDIDNSIELDEDDKSAGALWETMTEYQK